MVGTKFIFPELTRAGYVDVAVAAATSLEYPGFGFMWKYGLGTLCEQWHCSAGSRNHIMLGSQSSWYFSDLAGIKLPEGASGWDRVEVSPSVPLALSGVSASVGTVRGAIETTWARPPTYQCGEGQEKDNVGTAAIVNCTGQGVIDNVEFASFGLPTGTCGNYTQGCHSATSMETVRAACLGKPSCAVLAKTATFGGPDPCPEQAKKLVIQATCSQMPAFTLSVSLPAGIRGAELKVPLGNLSASFVTLKESNTVVWQVSLSGSCSALQVCKLDARGQELTTLLFTCSADLRPATRARRAWCRTAHLRGPVLAREYAVWAFPTGRPRFQTA